MGSAPSYTVVTLEDGFDLAEGVRYEIQGPKGEVGWTIDREDALLFAAAPELLEALENLLSQCAPVPDSESNLGREWNKAIEEASLALTKARGES